LTPGRVGDTQITIKRKSLQAEVQQNGGYSMDSQEKGAQNSRNNAARLRKLEKNYAQTSYFEVGIEKNTPPVATVPS